jgi:hypothetical protein
MKRDYNLISKESYISLNHRDAASNILMKCKSIPMIAIEVDYLVRYKIIYFCAVFYIQIL